MMGYWEKALDGNGNEERSQREETFLSCHNLVVGPGDVPDIDLILQYRWKWCRRRGSRQ